MLCSFPLDKKSITRLISNGLPPHLIKEQIDGSIDYHIEQWKAQGVAIIKKQGSFFFKTKFTPISEAEFCIVDIETNGSKLEKHQIIEIGAIKIKNGKVIDRFDTLVKCDSINKHITAITGITVQETQEAPELKDVMYSFKRFLGDAIFVAHDVKFDYKFISGSLIKLGLQPLLNRSLCSLNLAERTLTSYRYGLSYLNELFEFNKNATHHRAMSDVITTFGLFQMSLETCKEEVNNVEDLIKFSKEAPRVKRPKFDPLLERDRTNSEE